MNRTTLVAVVLLAGVWGCSSTLDGSSAHGPDGGRVTDVPPGVNPDGQDPFRPTDSGVILVDGGFLPNDAWSITDAPILDERYAYLYVGTYFAGATEATYVQAEFRYSQRPEDPRCTYHGAGAWDVSVCDDTVMPVMDNHPRPFPNAGEITVRGGTEVVTIDPQASSGQYQYYFQSRVVFDGPRTVSVSGVGSRTVPAFAQTLSVPPRLNVTAPAALANGTTLTLDRGSDLSLVWDPNPTRSVQVTLSATTAGDHPTTVRLYQEFHGSDGRGVIPASALRDFMAIGPGETATLSVMPVTISTVRVGNWPFQYTVVGRGLVSQVVLR